MTLIQAIEANRPFKRPFHNEWLIVRRIRGEDKYYIASLSKRFVIYPISFADMTATDWKVRPRSYGSNDCSAYLEVEKPLANAV